MEPADFIARLTPASQDFQQAGVSSVPGLGSTEAARALSGLQRGPYFLSLVLWAGDNSSRYDLENQLWGDMCCIATERKWIVVCGGEMLRGMAKMAVAEIVDPRLCGVCKGRGSISPRGGAVRNCAICNGSGRVRISERERARNAGIDRNSWRRVWGERYEDHFISRLASWEIIAADHVRQKLRVDTG